MKITITCILMLIITAFAQAQHFSGSITKETTIIAKKESINTDSILKAGFGKTSLYLITDGYYKSSYLSEGKTTYSYIYHKGEGKMFDHNTEDPYITYRDATKPYSTKVESKYSLTVPLRY